MTPIRPAPVLRAAGAGGSLHAARGVELSRQGMTIEFFCPLVATNPWSPLASE